jgi:phospholipid/cholesterol/gamma-HCH transport system substrate-binding protein
MMKNLKNTIKVGIFILITLIVFLVLTIRVGAYRFVKEGNEFYAYFNSIEGLMKHAPVRLSGFDVGEVKDIELVYDDDQTQIRLTLWINKDARPRIDSIARLNVLGLMGEKYVEISKGSKGSQFLSPKSFILSEDPIEMDMLMKKADSITRNIDELLAQNRDDLNIAISNLKVTSENMKDFSEDIKSHPWKLLHKTKEKPKKF